MKKFTLSFSTNNSKSIAVKGLVAAFLVSSLFFTGCYEWGNIFQPSSTTINSYFDVTLTAQDDGNPDNDWTNPDLIDYGLFGAMIPVGWDVQDSIPFNIVCSDPSFNNSGILVYSAAHSQTLQDSIPAPNGYYWWGAVTADEASMVYFQSLSFSPRIFTDDQVGEFFIRYAIGDMDYWDRNPADDVSDPISIIAIDNTGVNELLSQANISLYPNPVSDLLSIDFQQYTKEVVQLSIIDLTGKLVHNSTLSQQNNSISVDQLPQGVYFVNLRNGEMASTHKIVVR